ncbi:hypothetical protein Bca52824_096608 [Brassica carinata]|uniref:Phytocyanin domain-containing protein n=1 Tax=Brassica carinata TaxID=52824 RepID=A0A8X7P127_BRACI|nr:hypothetical protein Bca52824_096608 [Brassica carinata]
MMMSFTVLSGVPCGRFTCLEYDHNINDVTQVSGGLEYEFCDLSSPRAVYNTGHDIVTLTEPGFHYFITSNQEQCVLGQKLEVLVVQDPQVGSSTSNTQQDPSRRETYKVGDSEGWKVYDSDFYNKWSEEKQFHLGDSLIFEYANEVNAFMRSAVI